MTPQDKDALKAAASKATPGRWRFNGDCACWNKDESRMIFSTSEYPRLPEQKNKDDAKFIALANPTAILELLDLLDKYETELRKYRNE